MNKGHKLLSLLLCAAVLLTLISPAALAEGETLPEKEVVLSKTPAASAAQEGASGEAAKETPAPQATPRPQETQAADESPETTSAESPKESPAESPKESPAESPKESPAESPKESPAQTPAGEFTISYDYNGGAAGALLKLNAAQDGENAAQNGENAAPAPADKSVTGNGGQTIVLANAPIKPERDFAGWKSTLTGKQYAAGESYEIQGDDTLVAQWNMVRILEIDVQPKEGSALLQCENTVSAISEDEQALVEQAIKNAQPTAGDELARSAFEPEVLAADVSFIGADGSAQQPAEGETVPMTVTVPAGAMEGEGFWMVYHLTENGEGGYTATPVQFMPADANGASVQLAADGFSIYAVAKVHDTEGGTLVAAGSEIKMSVEDSQVFYYKYTDEDQYNKYTYHRYTWTIENNNDIVKGYATPMSNLTEQLNRYQYPWFSVDALREGTVTVKLNYYYYNGIDWWHPTEPVSGSIAFTIKVTEPTGLRILNNIVVDGTLKPVYEETDGSIRKDLTYVWSAKFFHTDNSGGETEITNEDSSIDLDAVYDDGSLNVAIDNGGIREETDVNGKEVLHVTTYTVTAYDENKNEVGKASHRVEFGGNVLNGSFEYPAIPSGSTNYAFANGTHQLFWRTTAPGPNHMLGQDVELGNGNAGNPYLQDGSAAHGAQYAELNAEATGTLYQDVLTAPGAELSWGFSHRSRKATRDNIMYLIIASSKDGAKIDTQAQINELIRNYTADGETVSYDGGSYILWKMEADANHWQNHFGSYTVPHNQYATRFFFASATGTTTGNLIDNVTFNQEQRYIIEYYLNGTKVDELTETKTAEVNTAVSPAHLESMEQTNAILTNSTINGESYGGVTMTILPRPTVDAHYPDCRNVLRLYFVTGAITVRKVVTIENWDDLTDAERKELGYDKPYIAKFELYEGAPGKGQKVADASISIDLINQSQKTGVAQFMQLNPDGSDGSKEPYKPKANTPYWVKELNVSTQTPLYAYGLTTTYAPNADGISDGSFTTDEFANGSVTVTNAYALHLFDLTIKTSGVKPIDENQTYIYRVRGTDAHTNVIDLTVAIHGDGQATVKNLAAGKYEVTQVNTWSWRYTPNQTEQSVTLDANGNGTIEYKQTRAHESDADNNNKWKWLNGQHWIDNRWKDGSSSNGVPGDEGGDENSIKD